MKANAFTRAIVGVAGFCFLLSVTAVLGAPQGSSSKELMRDKGDIAPQKFLPPTPEEIEAMMRLAKEKAREVSEKMRINLRTLETAHFIVFTDWDPREESFLTTNVELAYGAVSKQFDIPTRDNVFVGKLPVFMFAQHGDFMRYAKDFDQFDVPENVAGYYQGNSLGHGHMAMWKPDVKKAGGNLKAAEREWAYVLTHEFTHAFVARYRTNGFIPRWLNEGLAEVIASSQFPRPEVYPYVRARKDKVSVQTLLKQTDLLKAPDYPVVRTLVETLIVADRKGFITTFNDIKDGMSFEDALRKNYKTDNQGLEAAWRKYIQNAK